MTSYLNLPNMITGLRICVAPFSYYLIINEQWLLALSLCFFSGLSDFLDGYLARRLNQGSKFGELFDPIADKVFVVFIYIALYQTNYITTLLFFTVMGRDLLLILGAFYALFFKKNIPLHPLILSKINTFLQISLCGWLLLLETLKSYGIDLWIFNWFTFFMIYATFIITVLSGMQYAKRFIFFFRKS